MPPFQAGARDEHAVPVDVARGEDVRRGRREVFVDHHVPAVDRHAGRGRVDQVAVAGPAHGEEGGVDLETPVVVSRSVDHAHT
jgi:hypothetical protein